MVSLQPNFVCEIQLLQLIPGAEIPRNFFLSIEKCILNDKVWKFHYFSFIQILREINFGDSRSTESAIVTYFEALNIVFYECLHFLKAEIYQIDKIRSPYNCNFRTSKLSIIDFTENLSDRKILKFLHCEWLTLPTKKLPFWMVYFCNFSYIF